MQPTVESGRAGPSSPADRRLAIALSLFVLAICLATTALRFESVDEVAVFATARSLAGRGSLDADGLLWAYIFVGQGAVVAPGVDGHLYSLKDLAPSVLVAPLVWAAYRLGISPVRAAFLLPPVVTALTAGLLYRLARRLGFGQAASLLAALTFGLASMALPYAETLFTQPFVALWLTLATWGTLRAWEGGGWRPALAAGLAAGLTGLSAIAMWLLAPLFFAFLVPWRALRRAGWREMLPPLAAFAGGAGLMALVQAFYNLARFGSPLNSGHADTTGLAFSAATFGTGGVGLLVSFPRGVVWYAPFVLLVPIGAALAWRHQRRLVLLVAAISALVLGVYSAWFMWWGGLSWGPRFLVALMPLWALLCAPLFERLLRPAPLWARAATGAVLAASVAVQIAASMLNVSLSDEDVNARLVEASAVGTRVASRAVLADPTLLPPVQLARLAAAGEWDHLAMARGYLDAPLLAAQIGLIALGGAWLSLWALGRGERLARAGSAAQAALSVALVVWMLARYPRAPDGYSPFETPVSPGLQQVVAMVEEQAAPGDGLALVLPGSYLGWFDLYRGALPEANFPFESPLHPEAARMLELMSTEHARLWLVTRGTPGGNPGNTVEQWLAERAFAGYEIEADDGVRLVAYTFAAERAAAQPAGETFGGPGLGVVTLESVRTELTRQPGAAWLNVELAWSANQTPPADYAVTVQLFDAAGERAGQHDGWPVAGYAPTSAWEPGVPVIDRHSVALSPNLPPGDYELRVALYSWPDGENLPLIDGTGNTASLPVTIPVAE